MQTMLVTRSTSAHGESDVPGIFCWTKMGTEAGQPLETILRRKEFERKAGNGIFAWGIGNSLGSSPDFAKQATTSGNIDVLFSPMKSAPKAIDVTPTQLVLWLAYHSHDQGLTDLPIHMLITSRGNGASGMTKRSHYALLCERHKEINAESDLGIIDATCARNLVSHNPLGASQVTAMVRYDISSGDILEKPYPISFRARMHREGFVRLGTPVSLNGPLLSAYKELCQASCAEEWLEGVKDLKRQAKSYVSLSSRQQSLFSST